MEENPWNDNSSVALDTANSPDQKSNVHAGRFSVVSQAGNTAFCMVCCANRQVEEKAFSVSAGCAKNTNHIASRNVFVLLRS